MKEKEILREIIPTLKQAQDIAVGPGDDCAAIDIGSDKFLLIAADQTICGVHYDQAICSPSDIARKLIRRNISDIAAMGGTPSYAILTMASASKNKEFYLEFFNAISEEADKWGVSICGGDIASVKKKDSDVFTLTIAGWVEKQKICRRSSAKNGNILYATGYFGNSYQSRHHIDFTPRVREAVFLAGFFTNTMIDVSDGLLSDCAQLAEASKLSIILDIEAVPLRKGASMPSALSDGEDYELLFAVDESMSEKLEKSWPFKDIMLSRIGFFKAGNPGLVFDRELRELGKNSKTGFDHLNE